MYARIVYKELLEAQPSYDQLHEHNKQATAGAKDKGEPAQECQFSSRIRQVLHANDTSLVTT